MNIKKRSDMIMILLIIVVISIIFLISYLERGFAEEKILKCIAEKSELFVSKTCSICAQQKIILGDGLKYFNVTDVLEYSEAFQNYGLKGVPTWIIDGQKHEGIRSIEELKDITGC